MWWWCDGRICRGGWFGWMDRSGCVGSMVSGAAFGGCCAVVAILVGVAKMSAK